MFVNKIYYILFKKKHVSMFLIRNSLREIMKSVIIWKYGSSSDFFFDENSQDENQNYVLSIKNK